MQRALLQAWLALQQDVEVRDVKSWLYRIVHDTALNCNVGPLGRSSLSSVRSELAELPALQRQVLLRTSLEGQSHDEIAAALGLSTEAGRGLIYRVRASLRAAAGADADTSPGSANDGGSGSGSGPHSDGSSDGGSPFSATAGPGRSGSGDRGGRLGIGRGSIIRWPGRATSRAITIGEPYRHVRFGSDRARRLSELFSGSAPSPLGGLPDTESGGGAPRSVAWRTGLTAAPRNAASPLLPNLQQAGREGDRPKSKAHRPPSGWSVIVAQQPIVESCRSGQIARCLDVGVALQGRPPA